jgi:hypothetical protein
MMYKDLSALPASPYTFKGHKYTYYQGNGHTAHESAESTARRLEDRGDKVLIVRVLARNLKGKTDLHGKPYAPSLHVFHRKTDKYIAHF